MSVLIRLTMMLALLAGCGGTGPVRFDVSAPVSEDKIPVSVSAVEVREVSLPLYAELEVITVEGEGGALISDSDLLWADEPVRAITRQLAVSLAAMTRARVAAEPWPFFEPPDARVEVRFTKALAGADGQFRIAGQYFVASDGGDGRDVARRFALSVPYAALDTTSIAQARGAAVQELATLIARDGL